MNPTGPGGAGRQSKPGDFWLPLCKQEAACSPPPPLPVQAVVQPAVLLGPRVASRLCSAALGLWQSGSRAQQRASRGFWQAPTFGGRAWEQSPVLWICCWVFKTSPGSGGNGLCDLNILAAVWSCCTFATGWHWGFPLNWVPAGEETYPTRLPVPTCARGPPAGVSVLLSLSEHHSK